MIKLGWTVRDVVSGFQGIAVAKVVKLDGSIHFTVTPVSKQTNRYPEEVTIPEYRLKKVDKGIAEPEQYNAPLGFASTMKESNRDDAESAILELLKSDLMPDRDNT